MAVAVFHDLGGDRDIVTWNAMINGYMMVMHGHSREALEAFGQLRA
jgi:pentatricopeptide repeat protein